MPDVDYHDPVMVGEVLEHLGVKADGLYLDGTVGGGGHTIRILESCSGCRVIAVDRDREALDEAGRRLEAFGDRVRFLHVRFDGAADDAEVLTRWLSERADLASLTPQSDLASTKYCLANPGVEYLAYQPQASAKNFSVNLELGKYAVEWTNLVSGGVTKANDLQGGDGENTFTPPFDGPSILHLIRKR